MDHDRKTGPLRGERYPRRHLLEAWQVFVMEQSGWESVCPGSHHPVLFLGGSES